MQDYSAWGISWAGSWGESWGPLHQVDAPPYRHGASGLGRSSRRAGGKWNPLTKPALRTRDTDDEVLLLIL